ncbi:MAG: methyltransferase domain-containing protein [Pseudomonadota bacterium]
MKAYLEAARSSGPFEGYKRHLAALLALQPGERIVDIGCGLGDDLRAAAEAVGGNGRAVGIERDEETLKLLGTLAWPPQARVVAGEAEALPLADASFDAARMDRVLHMLADPMQALSEARRVLASHGRLLLAEPLWRTLRLSGARLSSDAVARQIARDTAEAPGAAQFDPAGLARAAGFEVQSEEAMQVRFTDAAEARRLLHLDRSAFALRLRKEIEAEALDAWHSAMRSDAADGSFEARLDGLVLDLRRSRSANRRQS